MKKAPAVKNGKRKKISASAIGIAIIFTLIFTLGLCTAADYGVYCDEPSEQVILRENLKEYAAAPFVCAVGGSWLCPKKEIAAGNFEKVEQLCREAHNILDA